MKKNLHNMMRYQNGGTTYVTDPDDPRLIAYKDSLKMFNLSPDTFNYIDGTTRKPTLEEAEHFSHNLKYFNTRRLQPTRVAERGTSAKSQADMESGQSRFQWTKPVQSVELETKKTLLGGKKYTKEEAIRLGLMTEKSWEGHFGKTPKMQNGGEVGEKLINATDPNEDQKFLIDMANSPLFQERFARQSGNVDPNAADKYRKNIIENVSTVKYAPIGETPGWARLVGLDKTMLGMYSRKIPFLPGLKNRHKIYLTEEDRYSRLHETSHASTLGRLKPVKPYIIDAQKTKSEYYHGRLMKKYLSTPTEIKARVDSVRKELLDKGLYDPINQKFTEKEYDMLFDSDEAQDLLNVFPKEEIMRMFNDIVYNKPKQEQEQMLMAKYGGKANLLSLM